MTLSIFLARFFGIYLIIGGLFYLFKRKNLKDITKDMYDRHYVVILSGAINVIIGLLIVISHNIWRANWRVIITIIGYLFLISGLCRMFTPIDKGRKWSLKLINNDFPVYFGILWIVVGVYLIYTGFIR